MWASERGERETVKVNTSRRKRRCGTLTCGPDCGALASVVALQVPHLDSGAVSWSPPDELVLL